MVKGYGVGGHTLSIATRPMQSPPHSLSCATAAAHPHSPAYAHAPPPRPTPPECKQPNNVVQRREIRREAIEGGRSDEVQDELKVGTFDSARCTRLQLWQFRVLELRRHRELIRLLRLLNLHEEGSRQRSSWKAIEGKGAQSPRGGSRQKSSWKAIEGGAAWGDHPPAQSPS